MAWSYLIFLAALASQLTLLAIATDVMAGHAGRVGMAAAVFAGIGGYTYAVLTVQMGLNPWMAILLSCLIAYILGLIIGTLLLEIRGDYFLLATFAIQMALVDLVQNFEEFGGALGIRNIPSLRLPFVSAISSTASALVILVPALIATAVFSFEVLGRHRPLGRAFWSIRDDEPSALAAGIPVRRLLITAFGYQAVIAALAGIGWAIADGYVGPGTYALWLSVMVLTAVFVGGTGGTWLAMFCGVVIILGIREGLTFLITEARLVGAIQQIAFHGILICVIFARPRGLAGPEIDQGPSREVTL